MLFSLPRELPGLFSVRFTAHADFEAGDTLAVKGRELAVRTRTMEDPEGNVFSAGAVVQCDIDMERGLAFVATGSEAQSGIDIGDLADYTPTARTIATEAPLTGGGDLSTDRTFAITPATAATETASGGAGSVVYAADNADSSIRDQAVTPAGLAAAIGSSAGGGSGGLGGNILAYGSVNAAGTLLWCNAGGKVLTANTPAGKSGQVQINLPSGFVENGRYTVLATSGYYTHFPAVGSLTANSFIIGWCENSAFNTALNPSLDATFMILK